MNQERAFGEVQDVEDGKMHTVHDMPEGPSHGTLAGGRVARNHGAGRSNS